MPVIIPHQKDPKCELVLQPNTGPITGEDFHKWKDEFYRRKTTWINITDVDLSTDKEKKYFDATIFDGILKSPGISKLVVFFGCKSKIEKHRDLDVYTAGVDQNCKIITPIYKGRIDKDGKDTSVEFDDLKKGQINWISRNLHMNAPGLFDPYNEFNGYAHDPSFLKRCFFETEKPEEERLYKKVAIYFGVDTRKQHRNTVIFIGIDKDGNEDLPVKDAITILAVDNGAQCCPIPDDPTPFETRHA
ncbi:hypothetical protein ACS5NO_21755 [Larkinella sp. GY13]|uniref:hypothetical protein n=1 Tax=Larkinella sp. GY13 TaxID=3453720 RepID=UPI003EEA2422